MAFMAMSLAMSNVSATERTIMDTGSRHLNPSLGNLEPHYRSFSLPKKTLRTASLNARSYLTKL